MTEELTIHNELLENQEKHAPKNLFFNGPKKEGALPPYQEAFQTPCIAGLNIPRDVKKIEKDYLSFGKNILCNHNVTFESQYFSPIFSKQMTNS